MKKTKAFYLVTVLAINALLLSVVSASAASEEAQRHFDRGQAAVEIANKPADLEDAVKEFQKAIDLAPNWPDPHYQLGMVQNKMERFDDAIKNLTRYLELAPQAKDAPQIKQLINKIEYRKEKAERERMDPNNLVGIWAPDEEAGLQFEIRNNNGIVEGGLRMDDVYLTFPPRPWFVPIKWDGTLLVIPHLRYFYCDKTVQMNDCPATAGLSLSMIGKDTLKGTLQIASFKHHDGIVSPKRVIERVWKRVK